MPSIRQTLSGSQQLKQDDNVTPISAGTTWDNIYGTTLATPFNVINFSGTSRSGTEISGSYTITNTATDTVQGLLSAIENAYSNQVTASISSSGRITVTDKFTGTSQLAIEITAPVGSNLDFGTVLTSNTDGVSGRYALAMTAADDGSSHLQIRNNDYGSGNSFTISQVSMDLGLVNGTYDGQNVAGTINGETATGSGQNLTGATGNANTAGLSIKYTGTANGADAGTVKLTLGLAALLDNTLFNITDSVSGYVPFKQKSLQDSADSFATQISEMEARLARKQEMMVNRFVAMEMALSKIQNQSNWLTGQINSASNGWQKQ